MPHLSSPNGRLDLHLTIEDVAKELSVLRYAVQEAGTTLLAPSRLGLWFGGAPPLMSNFELLDSDTREVDESWSPVCGERATVRDHYRELTITCRETLAPGRLLRLVLRAYDHGVAIRYELPEQPGLDDFTIMDDLTQWHLPQGAIGYDSKRAQGRFTPRLIDEIGGGSERPLTVRLADDRWVAIGEAGNLDAPRMKLRSACTHRDYTPSCLTHPTPPGTLEADLTAPIRASTPWQSPWRYLLVGTSPGQLLERNDLLLNLSPPCALDDTSWIRPGKVIREITLSMEGARACIDFAVRHHLQYIEFDAGWYGHEYLHHADATSCSVDPLRRQAHPELTDVDLPQIVAEARERGIGVWCYVNRRALERDLDAILKTLAGWGVAGVKYGFVEVGDQSWTQWLSMAIGKAAEHRLMVDIHDEYRTTGITRTYPHLLTVEGILGNEEFPEASHNVTLPFTRYIGGAADYTPCIADPRLRTHRCHQLAMAVVYFSPLQFLYWYDQPEQIGDWPELQFLDNVPTVWEDTRVLAGEIGSYVAIARRHGETWFLGVMTGDQPLTIELDLSPILAKLPHGPTITAWHDDPYSKQVVYRQDRATATLPVHVPAAGGLAAMIG